MVATNRHDRITGMELRRARRTLDISQAAIARRMGVPRSRVSTIEAIAFPTPEAARRYMEALEAEVREH